MNPLLDKDDRCFRCEKGYYILGRIINLLIYELS